MENPCKEKYVKIWMKEMILKECSLFLHSCNTSWVWAVKITKNEYITQIFALMPLRSWEMFPVLNSLDYVQKIHLHVLLCIIWYHNNALYNVVVWKSSGQRFSQSPKHNSCNHNNLFFTPLCLHHLLDILFY